MHMQEVQLQQPLLRVHLHKASVGACSSCLAGACCYLLLRDDNQLMLAALLLLQHRCGCLLAKQPWLQPADGLLQHNTACTHHCATAQVQLRHPAA
jgi:hypothetical protein